MEKVSEPRVFLCNAKQYAHAQLLTNTDIEAADVRYANVDNIFFTIK